MKNYVHPNIVVGILLGILLGIFLPYASLESRPGGGRSFKSSSSSKSSYKSSSSSYKSSSSSYKSSSSSYKSSYSSSNKSSSSSSNKSSSSSYKSSGSSSYGSSSSSSSSGSYSSGKSSGSGSYSGGSSSTASYSGGGSTYTGGSGTYSSTYDANSSYDEAMQEQSSSTNLGYFVLGLMLALAGVRSWYKMNLLSYALIGGGTIMGAWVPYSNSHSEIASLFVFSIGLAFYQNVLKKHQSSINSYTHVVRPQTTERTQISELEISAYKEKDPAFSRPVFMDFVSNLYHRLHTEKHSDTLLGLSPFITKEIIERASKEDPNQTIFEVIVGGIHIVKIKQKDLVDQIVVRIDANYSSRYVNNDFKRYVVEEIWTFERATGVTSLPPEKMQSVTCPSCGAPAHFSDAGMCTYCSAIVKSSGMTWAVTQREVTFKEHFSTEGLGHYEEEIGTYDLTVISPSNTKEASIFLQRHQMSETFDVFFSNFTKKIVEKTFLEIYAAWSALEWERIRHLVSDRLYASNKLWMDAYKDQGLLPYLEDIKVSKIELSRIETDMYYDSITVRIHASCYDYVMDSSGNLIGGSYDKKRTYTEYWTFIRSAKSGNKNLQEDINMFQCPSCGAPSDKMGETAECGYCGAKVSNAEYGWILSIIIQDEAYEL